MMNPFTDPTWTPAERLELRLGIGAAVFLVILWFVIMWAVRTGMRKSKRDEPRGFPIEPRE